MDEVVDKNEADTQDKVNAVIEAMKTVQDPEIPVNIYDLGLIYEVRLINGHKVNVKMTLTTPGCPVAQTLPGEVEQAIRSVDGVDEAHVEIVWEPPWSMDRMTDEAKLALNLL